MKKLIILFLTMILTYVSGNTTKAQSLEEYRIFAGNCFKGNMSEVKKYVESGKSVNPPAVSPFTALYLSIMKNQFEIVSYLLEKGANPNIANADKTTPLMGVFTFNKSIINPFGYVTMLLNKKANVNAKDGDSLSVLDLAATTKNTEVIRELISKGAKTNNSFTISLDGKSFTYSSLTWLIACFSNLDIVKLYVERGANVNSSCSVDGVSFSALDLASQSSVEKPGYASIVSYLRLKGAKPLYKEGTGTGWLSVNDILKSMGLSSNTSASGSSNCYTVIDSHYPLTACGFKLSGYKIHCNEKDQDVLLVYYPNNDKGDCVFRKFAGWYSQGTKMTDASWYLVTYKKSFEEAAKEYCNCN